MRDIELWDKLAAYEFPMADGTLFLFSFLAKTTTLTSEQVVRVMTEYRRFLYLAATSGEVVAPSRLVDEIWHRHMQDSRAYLNGLCEGVFGKVIHHSPGRAAQSADPAYRRTLDLYVDEFNCVPDNKIWPTPEQMQSRHDLNIKWGIATLLALISLPLIFSKTMLLVPMAMVIVWFANDQQTAPWRLRKRREVGSGGACGGGGSDGCGGGCGGD